jgi:hypothetical protein
MRDQLRGSQVSEARLGAPFDWCRAALLKGTGFSPNEFGEMMCG